MGIKSTKKLAIIGTTAAVYTCLTVFMPIPAYGEIQCRLSEALNLLAFLNPIFAPGIILGCFVSNLFSTVNPLLDSIFGTLHTACAMLFITKFSKNLFVASLWPTVFSFYIGGMILYVSGLPFTFLNLVSFTVPVMAGEFVAVTLIGYPLFKGLMKNKKFIEIIKGLLGNNLNT